MDDNSMDVDISPNGVNLVDIDWLKFLLDDNSLENLLKSSTDFSQAAYLTSTFLQQAEMSYGILRDIRFSENLFVENESPDIAENNKIANLKLLAVKTASFVSWNLDYIHKHLPAHHAYALLTSLVKLATSWEPLVLLTTDPQLNSLSSVGTFSLSLFCCWSLKFLVDESLPVKPSKVPYVHVSGLYDPCANLPSSRESVFKILQEKEREFVAFLEKILVAQSITADMPTIECFSSQEKDKLKACNWSRCRRVPSSEIVCQAAYSLGCLFFFRRSYLSALQAFEHCQKSFSEVNQPVLVKVAPSSVTGYVRACKGALKVPLDVSASVQEQVKQSLDEKKLAGIFASDLVKRELSLGLRFDVKSRLAAVEPKDNVLHKEIAMTNLLAEALVGRLVVDQEVWNLKSDQVAPLIQLCCEFYPKVSDPQRAFFKEFMVYVYAMFYEQESLRIKLNGILKNVLIHEELKLPFCAANPPAVVQKFSLQHPGDPTNLEHELLTCYDASRVNEIVQNLSAGKRSLPPYDRLHLAPELVSTLEAIGKKNANLAAVLNVLISKSVVCERLGLRSQSSDLLNYVDKSLRDTSHHKLTKQLKWLLLDNELQAETEAVGQSTRQKNSGLVDRAKSCVMSLKLNHELRPRSRSVTLSVAHLLNNSDWDLSCRVSDKNEIILFGSAVATVFEELKRAKPSASVVAKFMDSLAQMFLQKKGHHHHQQQPVLPFTKSCFFCFVPLITNPTVISILVSCLAKLLLFSDKEVNGSISCSPYESVWPNSLSCASQLDGKHILEALERVLDRGTKLDDANASWLRTLADLNFSLRRYHRSLRHFLHLGMVTSDHFSEPTSSAIHNDRSYEKMIQACVQLKCHTQAAILCQFLTDVDYATAFKCILERPVLDAGDAYYDCIWDATVLECVISTHRANAEIEKLCRAQRIMKSADLNTNRTPEAHARISHVRMRRFLRRMAEHYLGTIGLA